MPDINHLAVPVDDVAQATAFYEDWFDAQVVPSPTFTVPVAWVLLGDLQLHLVTRPGFASEGYHFSLAIEDRDQFEALYRRATEEGVSDSETFQHHLYQTTAGVVQLYLKDPSGNIVECDYARIDDLDPAIAALVRRWSDGDAPPEPTRSAPSPIHEPVRLRHASDDGRPGR